MAAVVAMLVALFLAFGTMTALAVTRMARLGELIPYQPGPRAGVGLLEFALVFVAFMAGQILGAAAGTILAPVGEVVVDVDPTLGAPLEPPTFSAKDEVDPADGESPPDLDRLAPTLGGAAVGSLLATLGFLAFWRSVLRRGPRFGDGHAATFLEDVGLGLWVFLMMAVPTYGLQALLMAFFPQKHEILEALDREVHLGFYAAAAFSSAVAAPIAEEVLFRGFLLPVFLHVRRGSPESWARMVTGVPVELSPVHASPEPSTATVSETDAHESPAQFRARGGKLSEAFRRTLADVCSFPVVASSTIFALLHAGQGPAPIPLFFFALALGYLYRQTGRLTPCVTAHFALNGTTMALAGLSALTRYLD